MKPRLTSSDTPNAEFFGCFAGAVIPARMPRFPNADGGCDFRSHGRINAERPSDRHAGERVFRCSTLARKCSIRDWDVGVYAHVRLHVSPLVCHYNHVGATILCCMSAGTSIGTDFGTRRDASGHGTSGQRRDTGGIYNYVISPCPVGVSGIFGRVPMTTPEAAALWLLCAIGAGTVGFGIGFVWGAL